MGFFDSKTLPDSKGKESFFGSYNIPVNVPAPEPKQSTLGKVAGFLAPTITKTVGKYQKGEDITSKDIIGSALEAGSYLIPAGAIARGVGLGIKGVGLASKVANGVATGAVSGGMFEAGGSIADGGTAGEIAKRTLTGAAFGGVAGGVVGAIGGGLAARKLAQKTEAQFAEEALARANLGPIPEASNPRLSLPAPRTPSETPIQLPSEGILASQAKLRETYTPEIITTAKKGGVVKTRPTSKSETITYPRPQVTPTTNVSSVASKPVSYTKDPVQSLTKVMETELPPNADPTFVSTTLANQTAKYDAVASVTPTDDLIDMAMGIKPIPEGISPVTIHTLTSIRKDLTVEQAMRLKNIYPLSQAGQDLSLARLKSGAIIDNPIDMMQSVEKELKEQVVKKGVSKIDIKNLFPDCGFN